MICSNIRVPPDFVKLKGDFLVPPAPVRPGVRFGVPFVISAAVLELPPIQ
jgi:hypothetical protein